MFEKSSLKAYFFALKKSFFLVMENVKYLDRSQSEYFLKVIVGEYVEFVKKYLSNGKFNMFTLDYEYRKTARKSEENVVSLSCKRLFP